MRTVLLLAFLFVSNVFTHGQTSTSIPSAVLPKQTYLVVYKPGPKWLPGKPLAEQPLKEHFKYMLSLYTSGTMRFAGPFAKDAGGAVLFEADGDEDALKIVKNDPAVMGQTFIYELNRWDLVQLDKYIKK